jgi:hypothetical protein
MQYSPLSYYVLGPRYKYSHLFDRHHKIDTPYVDTEICVMTVREFLYKGITTQWMEVSEYSQSVFSATFVHNEASITS